MPYGFSCCSPLVKMRPNLYTFLTSINLLRSSNCPLQYELVEDVMLSVTSMGEILLNTNLIIRHDTYQSFPFNIWPLSRIYLNGMLRLGATLDLVRDFTEECALRDNKLVPFISDKGDKGAIKDIFHLSITKNVSDEAKKAVIIMREFDISETHRGSMSAQRGSNGPFDFRNSEFV